MSANQEFAQRNRFIESLISLDSCETILTIPHLSMKSTRSVKRMSRQDLQNLVFNPVSSIPTIRQYRNTQKRHNQSLNTTSSYFSKSTNSSANRLITQVESSKGQTQLFHISKKIPCFRKICTQQTMTCLLLSPCVLAILGALIAAVVLFTNLPTTMSTTVTTTSATTVTTTTTTTSTTATTSTTSSTTTTVTTVSTSTTTTAQPTCSTCIVTYTDAASVPIGNYSCDDACRTTDHYTATFTFPSTNSSCKAAVAGLSNGTFCTFCSVGTVYYSTNNDIYYHSYSYGSYPYAPNSGIKYAYHIPLCANNNDYHCCCT